MEQELAGSRDIIDFFTCIYFIYLHDEFKVLAWLMLSARLTIIQYFTICNNTIL